MTTDNTQLIIELVRQATEKVTQAEERICNRLGRLEDFQIETIEKQTELTDAVDTLQHQVKSLQEHTKRISHVIVTHKKKAFWRLLPFYLRGHPLHRGNSITRNY
jgi:chromosome segregation ATPase